MGLSAFNRHRALNNGTYKTEQVIIPEPEKVEEVTPDPVKEEPKKETDAEKLGKKGSKKTDGTD